MSVPWLPEPLARFTRGRWPAVWLSAGCVALLWVGAAPRVFGLGELREEAALKRGLVERQAALASRGAAEGAEAERARAWAGSMRGSIVRADTAELAAAQLEDAVKALCTREGVAVVKLERARLTPTPEGSPAAHAVTLNVRLQARRMEPLAAALAAMETPAEGSGTPWLRLGNCVFTSSGGRFVEGVTADLTVFAFVEGAR